MRDLHLSKAEITNLPNWKVDAYLEAITELKKDGSSRNSSQISSKA